ncbi:hypothetical protein N9062_01465 [Akkermansiaceae bacterium]|nr:hypothetical protein [Akkermansiaceae bacterium]MDA7908218.1 hypothetical protein [Akkermansiaceae bacterium]MDA7930064.1 hypothetical protein [Akkermansiaceae bacterium]MDB4509649.1 hypothetical protein [Akkermansiaceae bacterium]
MKIREKIIMSLSLSLCSCAYKRDISYEIDNRSGVTIETVAFKTRTMEKWWGSGSNIIDGGKATQIQKVSEPISRRDFYGVYDFKYLLKGRKEKILRTVDCSGIAGRNFSLRFIFREDSIEVERGD